MFFCKLLLSEKRGKGITACEEVVFDYLCIPSRLLLDRSAAAKLHVDLSFEGTKRLSMVVQGQEERSLQTRA